MSSGAPMRAAPDGAPRGISPTGLHLAGISVAVGGRQILRDVTLDVEPGQVHVVMGPNGSGKSTLANAVMGRPGFEVTSGRIEIDGRDVTAIPAWERARAGLFLAPQSPVEVPGVDLVDLMQAAGVTGNVVAGIADEAARIGLDQRLLHRAVNVDLSGGEAKRSEAVQLAVLRPRYCVLDEIDSGLDVDALGAVARRIETATSEWGLGVLAVTHFQRLLQELHADQVHVLVDGEIVASGGPELAQELEGTGYRAYAAH